MKALHFIPASFLIIIFVLQACVSSNTSSISNNQIESIAVKTHDGHTFDLPWYEVKDGKLISILNTSRISLDKEQIIEVAINNPEPKKVNLQDALVNDDDVFILAFDDGQRAHHYKFYEFIEVNGQFIGYTYTGGYPTNVTIPWDNVKKINVEKKTQYMDASAIRVFEWTIYIALEFFAISQGYPGMVWLY